MKRQYDKAFKAGKVDTFNQELMLRIMSDDDRLILDEDIRWYKKQQLIENMGLFNFYITTDLGAANSESADFSVISVWALNNIGQWFWVDGIVKKQNVNDSLNDLFRLAQKYKPISVGIEVSGQQEGFIGIIQDMQMDRDIYFQLASDNNSNRPGIRPVSNTNKFLRFKQNAVPWFKRQLIHFPREMEFSFEIKEAINELELASNGGFKSKHDDFIDTITMLSSMQTFRPSEEAKGHKDSDTGLWEMDVEEEDGDLESYMV